MKLIQSGKGRPNFVFDREYRIEDGAKAFEEFEGHGNVNGVIRFDVPKSGWWESGAEVSSQVSAGLQRVRWRGKKTGWVFLNDG